MTTLGKIPRATIELATYEHRNKLLAIYIKSILNGFFFFLRSSFKIKYLLVMIAFLLLNQNTNYNFKWSLFLLFVYIEL